MNREEEGRAREFPRSARGFVGTLTENFEMRSFWLHLEVINSDIGKIMERVKIVTFVPETHADSVREAIGNAGGGHIGNYTHCTFSVKGIGRFKPGEGADPAIGAIGSLESVQEEKIEFVCERVLAKKVMEEIRRVHPYEEVPFDVYPLIGQSEI